MQPVEEGVPGPGVQLISGDLDLEPLAEEGG